MEEIQMKEAQINVQLEDLKRLSNEVGTIKKSSSSEFAKVEHVKKWSDLFAKKVDLMANDIKSVASSVASTDSKINICNERNARKNNIIVFNLVKNNHFSKAKDKEIMSGLFKALLPETDISKEIGDRGARGTQQPHILDLVITDVVIIKNISCLASVGAGDHSVLSMKIWLQLLGFVQVVEKQDKKDNKRFT
ncbi:hypothetical protein HELRODRAFT_158578 [Helobdella robusta]|uniref:Uncharacterized protein n=1 Tax=Helobdella robusta TaxID=6412 RepID=T1EMY8_HELRO|nr:hypothetical protein HELRODRAFT_158578 [Helobdella robusta]ESO12133.1 hypothetical protein HELRODRAFT_158578 [Helobdella robusta]